MRRMLFPQTFSYEFKQYMIMLCFIISGETFLSVWKRLYALNALSLGRFISRIKSSSHLGVLEEDASTIFVSKEGTALRSFLSEVLFFGSSTAIGAVPLSFFDGAEFASFNSCLDSSRTFWSSGSSMERAKACCNSVFLVSVMDACKALAICSSMLLGSVLTPKELRTAISYGSTAVFFDSSIASWIWLSNKLSPRLNSCRETSSASLSSLS
mmetsp:Transcript_5366/g.13085  ORF Transcript_5366/g.13085 Transcript_5366/m.13085 type:complete len:212 (+) Transcript_5366:189-824(+)